jgi:hypothetical protein
MEHKDTPAFVATYITNTSRESLISSCGEDYFQVTLEARAPTVFRELQPYSYTLAEVLWEGLGWWMITVTFDSEEDEVAYLLTHGESE